MKDPKSKVNRLTSACLDLESCLRFLKELKRKRYGTTTYEALLVSAIVFYARPFSENERRGSSSPSDSRVPDDVSANLSAEESILHSHLITLRNKAIAHAEWSFHPTGVTEDKVIRAMPFSIWKHFKGPKDIDAFNELALKIYREIFKVQFNALHELP